MKNDLEKKQADKPARATRADLTAMQERFEAILLLTNLTGTDDADALMLIAKIASGKTLEGIIQDAGRAALGLES